ncbi:hypothetical protein ACPV5V_24105, partial [Vibrio campbellii]
NNTHPELHPSIKQKQVIRKIQSELNFLKTTLHNEKKPISNEHLGYFLNKKRYDINNPLLKPYIL